MGTLGEGHYGINVEQTITESFTHANVVYSANNSSLQSKLSTLPVIYERFIKINDSCIH